MLVIRKTIGNKHETVDISRRTLKKMKNEGWDFVNIYNNYFSFVHYKASFEDDNFCCQVLTPRGGKTFCFGETYIVKKNIFGVRSFSKKELNMFEKLIINTKPEHWWD